MGSSEGPSTRPSSLPYLPRVDQTPRFWNGASDARFSLPVLLRPLFLALLFFFLEGGGLARRLWTSLWKASRLACMARTVSSPETGFLMASSRSLVLAAGEVSGGREVATLLARRYLVTIARHLGMPSKKKNFKTWDFCPTGGEGSGLKPN